MDNLQMWPISSSEWPGKVSNGWRQGRSTRANSTINSGDARDRPLDEKLDRLPPHHAPEQHFAYNISKKLLHIVARTLSLFWILLPRRGRPVRTKALHELHPLAYLDALRGYLALIIFTGHTMSRFWKWIPDYVLSVPWFQFPFRGGFASLDIFFWISGYAVTYRLVGFMQAKRSDKLLDSFASSVFRRYLRLFLPILPVTLVTVAAVKTGLAIPPENRRDVINGNPFWWWIKDSAHFMNPFTHILGYWTGETGSALIDPFWSLSAEFRSSMIMFLFCIGTCKLSVGTRKLLIWLCLPPFICWQAQWAAMAFLGMWCAECRQQKRREQESQSSLAAAQVLRAKDTPPMPSAPSPVDEDYSEKQQILGERKAFATVPTLRRVLSYRTSLDHTDTADRVRKPLLIVLFLYSFIILKDPYSTDQKTIFPHNLLNRVVPDFWHAQMRMHMHLVIGSFMMLYPLDQLPVLQRPLLTPFSQYLGELSFGIYAVHFPIRWMVWEERYVKWQNARHGNDAFDHFWIAFPGYAAMALLVLWAADLFRRLDMQVVKLCAQLERRLFEW